MKCRQVWSCVLTTSSNKAVARALFISDRGDISNDGLFVQ
jgi:hypothetical protein